MALIKAIKKMIDVTPKSMARIGGTFAAGFVEVAKQIEGNEYGVDSESRKWLARHMVRRCRECFRCSKFLRYRRLTVSK